MTHCDALIIIKKGAFEEIITRTQINALTDIQTHVGGIDDRERVRFILKYLLIKKKCVYVPEK